MNEIHFVFKGETVAINMHPDSPEVGEIFYRRDTPDSPPSDLPPFKVMAVAPRSDGGIDVTVEEVEAVNDGT